MSRSSIDAQARVGLERFLDEDFVTREAMLAVEPARIGRFVDILDELRFTDDGCSDMVDVWRSAYVAWCSANGVSAVSANLFSRAVRRRFGLKSVPSSRRIRVDGRRRQFRVFVDGPYEGGRSRSGRPCRGGGVSLESDERAGTEAPVLQFFVPPSEGRPESVGEHSPEVVSEPVVAPVPAPAPVVGSGGMSSFRMTRLDVEAYLARQAQLEAFVRCGYISRSHEYMSYDGCAGDYECVSSDTPFLRAFAESFTFWGSTGETSSRVHVYRSVRHWNGRAWEERALPKGEVMVDLSIELPVPDVDGSSVMRWCKMTMHLRETGARNYGPEVNKFVVDEFDASQGTVFSDNCLLGITLTIFDPYDGVCGHMDREFTFDIPVGGFDYFGHQKVTSMYALALLGDQTEVTAAMAKFDSGVATGDTRPYLDGEPEFCDTYAPRCRDLGGGQVDYVCGGTADPRDIGYRMVARQVRSEDIFSGTFQPVYPYVGI